MEKHEKLILTAGPSITEKEISYVNDAVINGLNEEHLEKIKTTFKVFLDKF